MGNRTHSRDGNHAFTHTYTQYIVRDKGSSVNDGFAVESTRHSSGGADTEVDAEMLCHLTATSWNECLEFEDVLTGTLGLSLRLVSPETGAIVAISGWNGSDHSEEIRLDFLRGECDHLDISRSLRNERSQVASLRNDWCVTDGQNSVTTTRLLSRANPDGDVFEEAGFAGSTVNSVRPPIQLQRSLMENVQEAAKQEREQRSTRGYPWPHLRPRAWADSIIYHPHFETVLLVIISLNCVLLVTVIEGDTWELVLEWLDLIFTLIFTIEFILKMLGMGPKAYFKNDFNKLDFVVVVEGFYSLLMVSINGVGSDAAGASSSAKVLRIIRLLRPLRTVTHLPALKGVIIAFLESAPAVGFTTLLYFFYLSFSSCLMLELFVGKFDYRCDVTGTTDRFDNDIEPLTCSPAEESACNTMGPILDPVGTHINFS